MKSSNEWISRLPSHQEQKNGLVWTAVGGHFEADFEAISDNLLNPSEMDEYEWRAPGYIYTSAVRRW